MVAVVTVAAVVLAGAPPRPGAPLDPGSTGPLGTKALVELLDGLGAHVSVASGIPRQQHGHALVLVDNLGAPTRRGLVAWVRSGGTLVVADPSSKLTAVRPVGRLNDSKLLSGCRLPTLRQVGHIQPAGGALLSVPPSAVGCFYRGRRPWLVSRPEGAGMVIALGGPGAFTNANLGRADNAVLASALLVAPQAGAAIRLLAPPGPGSGRTSLLGLVGPRVRLALVQLALAFVVLVLWRARRLGRPVSEVQPVQIEGSELVRAVGALLRRAHRPEAATAVLRAGLRQDLAGRLGVDPSAPVAAATAALTSCTDLPAPLVALALGGDAGGG
ncbi:MAG: hypothetical protein DLM54_10600, partial [Acidimicrobiales bacterium]